MTGNATIAPSYTNVSRNIMNDSNISKYGYNRTFNIRVEVPNDTTARLLIDGNVVASLDNLEGLLDYDTIFGFGGANRNILFKEFRVLDASNAVKFKDTFGDLSNFPRNSFYTIYGGGRASNGGGHMRNNGNATNPNLYGKATPGQRYTINLGANIHVVPYLKVNAPEGKNIIMTTNTFHSSSHRIHYITKAGVQEFIGLNWMNGDWLYFDVPEGVEVLALGWRETGYDAEFTGYFDSIIDDNDPTIGVFTGGYTWAPDQVSSDNNFYDEIWKKSARTVYVNMRDTFMDCPDRERTHYVGDTTNEMEQTYYALSPGALALGRQAVMSIVDRQNPTTGHMSNRAPARSEQEISSQTLSMSLALWRHYQFSGDYWIMDYAYPNVYRYLQLWRMVEDEGNPYYGLVRARPSSEHTGGMTNWYDWGNNTDVTIHTTLWWYASASNIRKMAEELGRPQSEKDWLDARLRSIEEHFDAAFWNEGLQAYATDWNNTSLPASTTGNLPPYQWTNRVASHDNTHIVDDRVNGLAVFFGLAPEHRYPAIRDILMGTDSKPAYENAGIYSEKYLIESLYLMGYPKDALHRLQKRHMEMTNYHEISTMWEVWNTLHHFPDSVNHGWSATGTVALSRYATGVEPTSGGYETWRVVPQMDGFKRIDTRVPAVIGDIDVTLEKVGGNFLDMRVVSPGNEAEIWVLVEEGQIAVQTGGI
jgi:hypothetical protein